MNSGQNVDINVMRTGENVDINVMRTGENVDIIYNKLWRERRY
jgi:hypothetical protein